MDMAVDQKSTSHTQRDYSYTVNTLIQLQAIWWWADPIYSGRKKGLSALEMNEKNSRQGEQARVDLFQIEE